MVTKSWYVVGMGGNLGNVLESFVSAIRTLHALDAMVIRVSSIYRSKPLPTTDGVQQGSYLNGVFVVESALDPEAFLSTLLSIEAQLGRDRKNATFWGPRTIDLDIIASSHGVVELETLTIPHKRMEERDFVLLPLQEVFSDWIHPVSGRSVAQLIAELSPDYSFSEGIIETAELFHERLHG